MRILFSWVLVGALVSIGCDDGRGGGGGGDECAAPPAAACAMSIGDTVPLELTGSSLEADDEARGSCGGNGPEVAFQWTAPFATHFVIDTLGSDFDTVLYVRDSCEGAELACNDDIRTGTLESRVALDLEACQSIIIFVDGFGPTDLGDLRLNIEAREVLCDDGIDNDRDGLVDCDDPDCAVACGSTAEWPPEWGGLEQEVLVETNRYREMGASCDGEAFGPAPAFEMNEILRSAARLHSMDMGEQGYFDHEGLDGRQPVDRIRDAGFTGASPWGENIAGGQPDAISVVRGWMNSPGHCRNIMNPSFRVIGIGYALVDGSPLGRYWTQKFGGSH